MSEPIKFAIADPAVALEPFTDRFACRLDEELEDPAYIRVDLVDGQVSGPLVEFDVKIDGVSMFTGAKLTVDNGKDTSINATTPAPLVAETYPMGAVVTVSCLHVGDGTAKGAQITIHRTMPDLPDPEEAPPPPPEGSWHTVFSHALGSNSGTITGWDFRFCLAKAAFAAYPDASKLRVTLKAASNAACTIKALYAGPASTAPSASSLTPLITSDTAIAAGQEHVATVDFDLDADHDLMLNFEATGTVGYTTALSGWSRHAKNVSGESDNGTVSGYVPYSSQLLISKIEVFA